MSLADFQRAMADLAGSPDRCRHVQTDPAGALADYTLSEREQARLAAVVHQPGMAVHCTIHRTTRLVPLDTVLQLTCTALGAALGAELDAYWAEAGRPAIRFDIEAARFVASLERRLAAPEKVWPWPAETIVALARLELAIETLRVAARPAKADGEAIVPIVPDAQFGLHPGARILALTHEPSALLAGANADPIALGDIPRGHYLVVLACEESELGIYAVPPSRHADVRIFTETGVAAPWMMETGLAVTCSG